MNVLATAALLTVCCYVTSGRLERQQRENGGSITVLKNTLVELEARMCNGVYLWRITGYARHLENARENVVTALHSPPFYTDVYGYKLCLRINPNGVDTGYGSHVSLFVHMMQSDWDDTLEWPFSGRISLSILDQSDDGEYKRHISETLVTRPNLLAFQRPTTPRNHKGYGDFCNMLPPNYLRYWFSKQSGRIRIFPTEVFWRAHGIKLFLDVEITSNNFSYRPDQLLNHRLVIGLVLRGPSTVTWKFPIDDGEITPKIKK